MKRAILAAVFLFATAFVFGQTVEDITVEQNGDFIKIGYKIAASKPGQIYRVRVLCSINGGLNTELRSVSGDTGDNVQGGKSEYFVVWDVLKDVDELLSADFIVRAELLNSTPAGNISNKDRELTMKWAKKWFHVGPAIQLPGIAAGFNIGVMGSFGAMVEAARGNYHASDRADQVMSIVTTSSRLEDYLSKSRVTPVSFYLSKRIVSFDKLQMHLLAGMQRSRMVFRDPNASTTPWHDEKVFGPAAGMVFDYSWLTMSIKASHTDPKQIEKDSDWYAVTSSTFVSATLGIRF